MSTPKQQEAFNKTVENHGNIGKAMIESGYTPASAKNPKNLTESKGFKELCKEYGLTEELVYTSLAEDIKNKPQDRTSELLLASKILGLLDRAKKETETHHSLADIIAEVRKRKEVKQIDPSWKGEDSQKNTEG